MSIFRLEIPKKYFFYHIKPLEPFTDSFLERNKQFPKTVIFEVFSTRFPKLADTPRNEPQNPPKMFPISFLCIKLSF